MAEVETIASDMAKCWIQMQTHTDYEPLKCDFCHHKFGDLSNLNKHVRLHATGEYIINAICVTKSLVLLQVRR
ncbi:PR domain zinc finger protein 13 [Atta colombica]|uniref:PR domain zinc finger protein 13 n=1 Tax=Atta colombica TaxID=520822 RepID=A0A195AVV2_9HYME|nr:PR domain zinc finger protein 13 [Atta colombica]